MILAPADISTPDSSPKYSYSESFSTARITEAVSSEKPEAGKGHAYKLDRHILSLEGGKLLLRLRSPLSVSIDFNTMECSVEKWNVRVPISQTAQIPAKLSRKFLTLFSKVDQGTATPVEMGNWVNILQDVDFQRFSIDRASPHYIEGEVIQKQPKFVRVEWHDGAKEKIEFPTASAFSELEVGDEFSAKVKLGLESKTVYVEHITLI